MKGKQCWALLRSFDGILLKMIFSIINFPKRQMSNNLKFCIYTANCLIFTTTEPLKKYHKTNHAKQHHATCLACKTAP